MDYPTVCPHGGSIPKEGELLVEKHTQTLSNTQQLGTYRLVRVHDYFQLLHYLESHQLAIQEKIELIEMDRFAQTFTISFLEKELTIPDSIAQHLYVEKINR